MQLNETMIINLPFSGFYESVWSGEIDHTEEQEIEYSAEERELEQPKELRLSAGEFADIFMKVTDYSAAYRRIAEWYVEGLDCVMRKEYDLRLGLAFESMDSPREYNFATDRVYAHISYRAILRMFALSKRDKHARLAEVIRERFTSYSGFRSHYPNAIADWLDKPLEDWDHNELGTLLIAVMPEEREWSESVYYATMGDEGGYQAWSDAVDWRRFDTEVAELRADKADEMRESDPDYVPPPPRCAETLDMFTGLPG